MSNAVTSPTAPYVLIAEDSATQAQNLQHVLEKNGHRVAIAANGKLALAAAHRRKPALVISDVVMPEMDGYELCSRIKSDARLSDVPVILVTTLSDPQDVIRGLECRADNFILKPYDADNLLNRIQSLLASSRMPDSPGADVALEIEFAGCKHFITADRPQILNLLLSTYEAAIQRNKELRSTRDELRTTNLDLQRLTAELEDRVRTRTLELEHSNEALRQAQQALIQQERLRALGQMASGIAHDINNAISPISLYTESLLEREDGLSDRTREYLLTIQRAINDVAQTVARLREFYRPGGPELQTTEFDLNVLVKQVIDLTRARWSDQLQQRGIMIELKTDLASDLPGISGAGNEIRDALTNLIFNAVDAMPGGGMIEVNTRIGSGCAPGGAESPCVQLEVRDHGTGMDEETRRRCLEPFFTTKGERGTGLGLAMVYGMVQRHGARLEIDSEYGAGTTVRLLFFRVAGDSESAARMPPALPPLRSLRVLLVDDDPVLTESLSDTLRQDGHVVTITDGGQAGIDAFHRARHSTEPFDVVITDLGTPNVDGGQEIGGVRAAAPHTPGVLLTGWGQAATADGDLAPLADRLLSKPPRLRELRAALAEVTEQWPERSVSACATGNQ